MRTAIVSDIHGNFTALEAVLTDLRETAPDLILHGGDLADGGSRPVEVVDCIRSLSWPGVMGNGDEMLARPESLREFASQQDTQLQPIFTAVAQMADATRGKLGAGRLAWLGGLPLRHVHGSLAVVHASPDDVWRAPSPEAGDEKLSAVYASLAGGLVVYGHIHRPFVRTLAHASKPGQGQTPPMTLADSLTIAASGSVAWASPQKTIANSGSVGLSYDGDPRACYLLVDDGKPTIRRVAYDLGRELQALAASGIPHSDWVSRMLLAARPAMP